jgi:hypothetical protein
VFAQVLKLVREDHEAPVDLRSVGAPATELVVEDDAPLVREPLERPKIVVRRAGAPVQAHERRPSSLAGDAIPRSSVAPV